MYVLFFTLLSVWIHDEVGGLEDFTSIPFNKVHCKKEEGKGEKGGIRGEERKKNIVIILQSRTEHAHY